MEKATLIKKESSTYKIVIPREVEDKIRLLCSEVSDVEWSGALFYTYLGSFETNDLKITCQDICVMDIGTGGYTEFIESPEIIAYQMENNLLDCKIGLIHSHNKMATFFSGTDTATLLSEGSSMNNFVSLIVNNEGKYTAAITRDIHHIQDIRDSSNYKFFGEQEVEIGSKQYYAESHEIQYFSLIVEKEESSNNQLLARLEEIRKSKSKRGMNNFATNTDLFYKPLQPFKFDHNPITHPKWSFPKESVTSEGIPKDVVKTAVLQLITGSIIVTTKNKLTIEGWIPKVDQLFSNRFKTMEDFEYWVDGHIDAILNTTYDGVFEYSATEDDGTYTSALALEISAELERYTNKSKYIKSMCDIILRYIL